ncbi:DUF917 domain-containing protein [Rhizohabitans arisaemae]|uniref:DUF917 domain-containing protein n=1 Tax=Rhizohabitans arisaemae TaxID=2720610 RepID=UPI0024B1B674|nr:DUF917 domain-containing protein [Rhizohabitans arisaemae]
MEIASADLADLAAGATLLGSGGGGDTVSAAILVRRVLERYGPVRLVAPSELDPDDWVITVAAIGAITVMLERLPGGDEFVTAVRTLERWLGVRASAVQGMEAAGFNALIPVAVAAWLDLPLVDADGMGRAFPRLDQTVFTLSEVPAAPAVLVDPSGDTVIIGSGDNAAVERLARAALPALGAWAASALYPMRAGQVERAALTGSFSRAIRLGRMLRTAQRTRARAGLSAEGGEILFSGAVLQVRQRTPYGLGVATLEHTRDRERTLRIELADEFLLALDDGSIVGCVPDLISLVDTRSWQPVSADRLTPGRHVDVLRLPAPARWHEPAGRALAGPAAFGLYLPEGM